MPKSRLKAAFYLFFSLLYNKPMIKDLPKNLANALFAFTIVISIFFVVKLVGEVKSLGYIGRSQPPANTINLTGLGEVEAVPDISEISFSVREEGKTVSEAQKKVTEKARDIISFLKESKIDEKDIKTVSYNSYPKYKQQPPCYSYPCPPYEQEIVGYEVSQNILVKVRALDDAGKILEGLGDRKVTDLWGPNFSFDDEEKLKAEARSKAIADVRQKAKVLAKDLGVRLGRIVSFSESGNYPFPVYGRAFEAKALGMGGDGGSLPPEVPAGQNKISTTVNVTYEIK
jgi:hypothetical protein